jgi:hypothetical protein
MNCGDEYICCCGGKGIDWTPAGIDWVGAPFMPIGAYGEPMGW